MPKFELASARARRRLPVWRAWVIAVVLVAGGAALPSDASAVRVFVSNNGSASVSVFSIGAAGALDPVSCDPTTSCKTGTSPLGVAVDPSGRHLYVANQDAASVSAYSIGASGVLSPLDCNPATICKTGTYPEAVAVDPAGRHLYVTNNGSDSVSVFSIGADGVLAPVACDPTTICKTGHEPEDVAIDPAGSHVYVTNNAGSVSVFSIGAGGALAPVSCDPTTICKTGTGPRGVAIDPSGKHLFVANDGSSTVSVFSIGAGGALAPVSCDPTTICKTRFGPVGLAVDPSGSHVYVANEGDGSMSVFSIGPGGVLAPVSCDPTTDCETGDEPLGVGVEPSGRHLYVSTYDSSSVSVFSIGAGGALTRVTCDPTTSCKAGTNPYNFSLVVSPDRGPTAAFSASPGLAGSATTFDGSGSASPDYPVVAYAWSFGDGKAQTTTTPTVHHAYAAPGSYPVSLTVTDQAGCSQAFVFTGQTASCNGSPKARASNTISVPGLAVGKLSVSPSAFRAARSGVSAHSARSYGTKVTYTLNAGASVRFTVRQVRRGRKVHHGKKTACARPTRKNAGKKKCKRTVKLKGSFKRSGVAGTNTFHFTGRLKGKRLHRGKYKLVATPIANGKAGRRAKASFKIIR